MAPDDNIKTFWDILGFVFIVYQALIVPYRICFDEAARGGAKYLEDSMDFYFMLDILVNFNCGYYLKGNLIMRRKKVIFYYIRTWFLLDVAASFPYDWCINTEGADDESQMAQNY
jgi:hypothetical protein